MTQTIQPLTANQAQEQLQSLPPGWEIKQQKLSKQFSFENFTNAVEFVNQLADKAETANHHPDITINYNQVLIELTTHSANGITQKDFDLAKEIDTIIN